MRRNLILAIVISAFLHAGILFGDILLPKRQKAPEVKVQEEEIIQFEMPPLEPEPEDTVEEITEEQVTNQLAPPSLLDLPTIVPVDAFVQQMQPPPPPGLEVAKGAVNIPVTKPGTNFGKGMKDLFDISNLDQVPVPRVQVEPRYPFEMSRAMVTGNVMVAFIVSSTGDVVDAYAVRSSRNEFESAAVEAVMKWKFRPGRKGGRAVSTKMAVPISFTLTDQ